MRKNQDAKVKGEKEAAASINAIEAAAEAQYKKDLEAQKAVETSRGAWELDAGTGYLYNAAVRYYYDRSAADFTLYVPSNCC